jgi:hypothetical protein
MSSDEMWVPTLENLGLQAHGKWTVKATLAEEKCQKITQIRSSLREMPSGCGDDIASVLLLPLQPQLCRV